MNSKRQQQIANAIKKEFSDILLREMTHVVPSNVLISVTDVQVTPDLSIARLYFSIFNSDKPAEVMESIVNNHSELKRALSKRIRNFRRIPELEFYQDDGLENAQRIDELLRKSDLNKEDTE